MAVAHRGHQEAIRTDTSDPWVSASFTTMSGDRGLLVSIVHGGSSTDHVVGVEFGGANLTRIVRATDTANEPGAAEFWFIGSSLPITSDNITVDLASGTTDDLHLIATALTGSVDLEVIDFDSISENAANPVLTMNKGGRTAVSYAAMYGGGAAPGGTLSAGNTATHDHDLTAFYSQACRETTVDADDHAIGWSTLASDDLAFVAVCISEVLSTKTLEAAIASLGAVTGDFVRDQRVLAASVSSVGAVSPIFVRNQRVLATSVSSTGAVSAANSVTRSVAATITSVAAVAADMMRVKLLAVEIASTGAVTSALALTKTLASSVAGIAALAADLTVTAGGAVVQKLRTLMGVGQ